jgi:hypothetical protein
MAGAGDTPPIDEASTRVVGDHGPHFAEPRVGCGR